MKLAVLMFEGLTHTGLLTTELVPVEMAYVVRRRQRRLKNIFLHYDDSAPIDYLLPELDALTHVTSYSLFLTTISDCARASLILNQAPRVAQLSVVISTEARLDGEDYDPQEVCNKFVRLLFSRWAKQTEKLKKLEPAKLALEGFNFEHSSAVLAAALGFANLNELELLDCTDCYFLVAYLNQANVALKSFIIGTSTTFGGDNGCLDKYLSSFRGLNHLKLSYSMMRVYHGVDCHWTTLRSHESTLRSLFIDDSSWTDKPFNSETHDRSLAAFRKLCEGCSSLEQLAIQTPSVANVDVASGEALSEFLVSWSLERP